MVCHTLPLPHNVLTIINDFVTIQNMPSNLLEKHYDNIKVFPKETKFLGWGWLGENCVQLKYEDKFVMCNIYVSKSIFQRDDLVFSIL